MSPAARDAATAGAAGDTGAAELGVVGGGSVDGLPRAVAPDVAPGATSTTAAEHPPEPPPAPLLELADGVPAVVATPDALTAAARSLAAGSGPVAVDAERAGGYRYGQRAYLVQFRREGSTTFLVDPLPFPDLSPIAEVLGGVPWVLHAASQDLPCLAELGLRPAELFDTELAARLLGRPRVGLGPLVEAELGVRMAKEHSAADWSTRPLPEPWLRYAALDVEVLVELRDRLADALESAGKRGWAQQEFDHLRDAPPTPPRTDPWRRTSGVHRVRRRRGLAVVRALWQARDETARRRDVAPGRVLPDAAIVSAALALPDSPEALAALPEFRGRGARRHLTVWWRAVAAARDLPESSLPGPAPAHEGPPPARAWAERDPAAAARLAAVRSRLAALSAQVSVPVENICSPDAVRRVCWAPPDDLDGVAPALAALGARPWQVELAAPALVAGLHAASDGAEV